MSARASTTDRLGAIALGLLVLLSTLAPCLAFAASHDAAPTPEQSAFRELSTAALGSAQRVLQGDGLVRVEPVAHWPWPEAGAPPPVASERIDDASPSRAREPSASRSPVLRF